MLSDWFLTKKKVVRDMPKLHVTLWPSMLHFKHFANDPRLAGIRLNSAMMSGPELDIELEKVKGFKDSVPLYYDIKGRQLRVRKVYASETHLELDLNHPIEVDCPTVVLFKAGADRALLTKAEGTHLVFKGGPRYNVKEGESLHIRHPSLKVSGPVFLDYEIDKIEKVVKAGFTRFYLSYVEDMEECEEFRSMIGPNAELILKIESKKGLEFVQNQYGKRSLAVVKTANTRLMAARGDLFVELDKPHEILNAVKAIVQADPNGLVGSRILLSVINSPVPECDDFSDLAWLYDIGYNNFLLCDELCLKGELLERAVAVFDAFRNSYKW